MCSHTDSLQTALHYSMTDRQKRKVPQVKMRFWHKETVHHSLEIDPLWPLFFAFKPKVHLSQSIEKTMPYWCSIHKELWPEKLCDDISSTTAKHNQQDNTTQHADRQVDRQTPRPDRQTQKGEKQKSRILNREPEVCHNSAFVERQHSDATMHVLLGRRREILSKEVPTHRGRQTLRKKFHRQLHNCHQ